MMRSYFQEYPSTNGSHLMRNFFIMDSNLSDAQKVNQEYFLYHAKEILSLNLKPKIKNLIYHAICNEEVLAEHETPENTPVFCRVPFYLALNKDKNIFFKMIDFFDESLNQYFQSRLDANNIRTEYKEAFQNVVNNKGFKKIEALVNSGQFLPFQDRLIMTTLEKEKLETLIPNNQKEGKKLKI